MPPAARVTDIESCPHSPSAPIALGSPTVAIESLPAARVGDKLECPGGPTQIESGAPTVKINGHKAARMGDTTCHKGRIVKGAATVRIGNGGGVRSTTLDTAHRDGTPFVRG
jgi:uncharacterized Zn-binding protein involved in type VI secretion